MSSMFVVSIKRMLSMRNVSFFKSHTLKKKKKERTAVSQTFTGKGEWRLVFLAVRLSMKLVEPIRKTFLFFLFKLTYDRTTWNRVPCEQIYPKEWMEPKEEWTQVTLRLLFKTHNHVDKNKSWKQILHLTKVNKKDKYIFYMFYSQIL